MDSRDRDAIIGGRPAGLTSAYELSKAGVPSVMLEKDNVVGGLSRTVHYKGYHFDIGGHRFFTKVKPVDDMRREVLGDNFLRRGRLSRIYYRRRNLPMRCSISGSSTASYSVELFQSPVVSPNA